MQEASVVGVEVLFAAIEFLPKAVQDHLADLVALVAEIAVDVIVVDGEVPSFKAAGAGHPNGRMRLLVGAGPDVDVAYLGVFAVEGEGLPFGPSLDDKVVSFQIFLAEGGWNLAVGEYCVH